ncbi:hypothetical protein V6N13_051287 [Hibiscus sabdariffa]
MEVNAFNDNARKLGVGNDIGIEDVAWIMNSQRTISGRAIAVDRAQACSKLESHFGRSNGEDGRNAQYKEPTPKENGLKSLVISETVLAGQPNLFLNGQMRFEFFNPEHRRLTRRIIREALEEDNDIVSFPIGSVDSEEKRKLEEARAVWEVSIILEISFKGGRRNVVKVCELEDESMGAN